MAAQLTALLGLHKAVTSSLEARAQNLTDRLAELHRRGDDVMSRHEQQLDAVEADIVQAEDAINQLSNGGPPLTDTFSGPTPPYPGADLRTPGLVAK